MKIVVVKYNAGNIESVITDNVNEIISADKVIFPGQGEAGSAMEYLRKKSLGKILAGLQQPFLGICLGLQLMCKHSEEKDTQGLNIFNVDVKKFSGLEKVPHIGWNKIKNLTGKIFNGISDNSFFYFVHSYYAENSPQATALCDYGVKFSAALSENNFHAVQFHPEKSALNGEKLLRNFIEL